MLMCGRGPRCAPLGEEGLLNNVYINIDQDARHCQMAKTPFSMTRKGVFSLFGHFF
ncbi:hypothetical protein HS9_02311 [Bacillus velezensis]|nr:hypothetical protein HS9_02311 [Bacillus velezensis]